MRSVAMPSSLGLLVCVGVAFSSVAEMRPLTPDGRAEAWLSGGVWMGPGGLSLLGVDFERDVRPCPGDALPNRFFDETHWSEWTALSFSGDSYVISDKGPELSWAGGCAYAQLYIRSETARVVSLYLRHGGISTTAWVNGGQISETDRKLDKHSEKIVSTTDQGNRIEVETEVGVLTSTMRLPLVAGHNRILLKFYLKQKAGGRVFFDARFGNSVGLLADVTDSETDIARHAVLGQMRADVTVSAPSNLPHPGDVLSVKTAIIGPWRAEKNKPVPKVDVFPAIIEQIVCDWDGQEKARVTYPIEIPGTNTADLCKAGSVGYYSIYTTIRDATGRILQTFPADGFSVISGTVSQRERYLAGKTKTATCFYWLNEKNCELIYDWMLRMGIYHNVGGAAYDTNIWSRASARGVTLTADFLDPWNSASRDFRFKAAANAAPYTKMFKAWNEIDISRPRFKGTPESWTARSKEEFEAVKAACPNAIYTGGSLVRVGDDDWFRGCLTNGLVRYIDVWDVHAYIQLPPILEMRHLANSENEGGPGVEKAYREVLGRENDKMFVLGECGARCSHGKDARRWQADMVAKMNLWAGSVTNYLQIAHLVPWEKSVDGWDISIAHYPAEAALYTVVMLTDGMPYRRLRSVGSIQAAKYGQTLAAWSTKPRGESFDFSSARDDLIVVDVVGRVNQLVRKADGRYSLWLTSSPQYVLPRPEYDKLSK